VDELWVGTDTGLYRGNGKDFRRIELPSFLGNVQILSLLRDRDSNIWVGTTRGLLRINAKGISFSEENELRGDGGINVLFEDREGKSLDRRCARARPHSGQCVRNLFIC